MPALVVLSPATSALDQSRKPEEYKSVPAVRRILIVDPNRPGVIAHARGAAGWDSRFAGGLDAVVEIADPARSLPLAAARCRSRRSTGGLGSAPSRAW